MSEWGEEAVRRVGLKHGFGEMDEYDNVVIKRRALAALREIWAEAAAEERRAPIASAPKTGEHILVTALGGGGFGLCGGREQDISAVVHWWDNPGEEGWYLSLGNCDDRQDWPTHWEPLR